MVATSHGVGGSSGSKAVTSVIFPVWVFCSCFHGPGMAAARRALMAASWSGVTASLLAQHEVNGVAISAFSNVRVKRTLPGGERLAAMGARATT